jgi:hypothetical protein
MQLLTTDSQLPWVDFSIKIYHRACSQAHVMASRQQSCQAFCVRQSLSGAQQPSHANNGSMGCDFA